VNDIRNHYNSSQLNLILPFTVVDSNIPEAFSMQGGNQPLQVSIDSTSGFCMDPFAPDFNRMYLLPLFYWFNIDKSSAFWLERNTPYLTGSNMPAVENPFADLPFYPGQENPSLRTLPDNSVHRSSSFDFDLHSIFGSMLAK
jgi:hypothetical protein